MTLRKNKRAVARAGLALRQDPSDFLVLQKDQKPDGVDSAERLPPPPSRSASDFQ